MDSISDRKKDNKTSAVENDMTQYRENIRKLMRDSLQNAIDEETQKATQELLEEQRKAIRQILEEHKNILRQIVDEEKKTIWEKSELMRQSILKLGL
jgi:uncharacterized membrane protein